MKRKKFVLWLTASIICVVIFGIGSFNYVSEGYSISSVQHTVQGYFIPGLCDIYNQTCPSHYEIGDYCYYDLNRCGVGQLPGSVVKVVGCYFFSQDIKPCPDAVCTDHGWEKPNKQ